jgi:ParB-like chromosome segregation protein Spo0J
MNAKIQAVDPKLLLEHPLNKFIGYGDPSQEFVESVRQNGILTPILVTQSLTIISGRRRKIAAIAAGLAEVPAIVHPQALDDLEIRKLLIHCNQDHPKTVEQRAREFAELAAVEKELAKRRQSTAGGQKPGRKSASGICPGSAGEAKEIAADAVGMDRKTAEKAAEVVKEIDQAEAAGDAPKAAELRHKLEHESVSAAHRAAKPDEVRVLKAEAATEVTSDVDALGVAIPRRLRDIFAGRTDFDAILALHAQCVSGSRKLAAKPVGERLNFDTLKIDFDNARRQLRFAKPFAVCPECKASGKDCEVCKKTGWITEAIYAALKKAEPDAMAVANGGAADPIGASGRTA